VLAKYLPSTKSQRRQNIGGDKISALTKHCLYKYMRQQIIGTCAEASPYLFGPAKSAAADFSQPSLMFSYFSQTSLMFFYLSLKLVSSFFLKMLRCQLVVVQ
jgi:hypothetical protein